VRDEVVDFVQGFTRVTELPTWWVALKLAIQPPQYYRWVQRYGSANAHNGRIPRDHWLEDWERDAILTFHETHPLEGYRRLSFMMLDARTVAVSPSTVYRVLKKAGRLDRFRGTPSKKGTGFQQPLQPHEHWHVDITYLNIAGTFYYLCAVLDGYSRVLVHWEIRERMTEADVETILQRAREQYPEATPRIISDNGPQFIAKDFKEFVRISGMTHVRTSPYYPQSNGKMERWNQTVKVTTIRPNAPGSLDEARRLVATFVAHYNTKRLHSAIGYVTPADKLAGRETAIWAARDQQLEAARERRRERRQQGREETERPEAAV
jgi:transposase InsO family protein